MKIYIPMNGEVLMEEIQMNCFEIKTWTASIQMQRMFKAKQEGTFKLLPNELSHLKNTSLKKSLIAGSSISFYTI